MAVGIIQLAVKIVYYVKIEINKNRFKAHVANTVVVIVGVLWAPAAFLCFGGITGGQKQR